MNAKPIKKLQTSFSSKNDIKIGVENLIKAFKKVPKAPSQKNPRGILLPPRRQKIERTEQHNLSELRKSTDNDARKSPLFQKSPKKRKKMFPQEPPKFPPTSQKSRKISQRSQRQPNSGNIDDKFQDPAAFFNHTLFSSLGHSSSVDLVTPKTIKKAKPKPKPKPKTTKTTKTKIRKPIIPKLANKRKQNKGTKIITINDQTWANRFVEDKDFMKHMLKIERMIKTQEVVVCDQFPNHQVMFLDNKVSEFDEFISVASQFEIKALINRLSNDSAVSSTFRSKENSDLTTIKAKIYPKVQVMDGKGNIQESILDNLSLVLFLSKVNPDIRLNGWDTALLEAILPEKDLDGVTFTIQKGKYNLFTILLNHSLDKKVIKHLSEKIEGIQQSSPLLGKLRTSLESCPFIKDNILNNFNWELFQEYSQIYGKLGLPLFEDIDLGVFKEVATQFISKGNRVVHVKNSVAFIIDQLKKLNTQDSHQKANALDAYQKTLD